MKKCPYCAEEIQDEAIFCRYCNHDLRGQVPPPPPSTPPPTEQSKPEPPPTPIAPESPMQAPVPGRRVPHEWTAGNVLVLAYALMALSTLYAISQTGLFPTEHIMRFITGGAIWAWIFTVILLVSRAVRRIPRCKSTPWLLRLLWIVPLLFAIVFLLVFVVGLVTPSASPPSYYGEPTTAMPLGACTPVSKLTMQDAGKYLCVCGTISSYDVTKEKRLFWFPINPTGFYLYSYVSLGVIPGDCVQARGRIEDQGGQLAMRVENFTRSCCSD